MEARHAPSEVVSAVKDYGATGVSPKVTYRIDGHDVTPDVQSANWGWGDGGSQLLKMSLAGRIPRYMQNREVTINASILGHEWEMFASAAMRFTHPDNDWRTDLLAVTAGGGADKVTLNDDLDVLGWTPQQVAYNGARRLPYDPSKIRIAPLERPLINRTGPDILDPEDSSFLETEYVRDMFSAVNEDVPILYYDTARGFKMTQDPGLGTGLPIDWYYQRHSQEIINWPTPERVDPDKEYDLVVVLDKNDSGLDRIRYEWPINRRAGDAPGIPGQTLYIPITDTSSQADQVAAILAKGEADKATKGLFSNSFSVVWNPFLFPGRALQFEENYRDNAGLYHILWLCVLNMNITHDDAGGKLMTSGSYTATKLEEELIRPPALLLSNRSAPWLKGSTQKIFPPAVGRDSEGLYVIPEYTAPSNWIRRDAEGLRVDTDASEGFAGRDGSGFYMISEETE